MKCRNDFVTNSSSSSFIIAFNSAEEGESTIVQLARRFGSMYVDQLLQDFQNAQPKTLDEILKCCYEEFESDAEWNLDGSSYGYRFREKTFREKWMESHPGADSKAYYGSSERKEAIKNYIEDHLKSLSEAIGDRSYIINLDYEDHDEVGSALEHDILPDQDFVAWCFSHH